MLSQQQWRLIMNMRTVGIGMALAGVLSLSACGEKAQEFGQAVDLQGTYQTRPDSDISIASGIACSIQKIDITGTDMDIVQAWYDHADCTGKELGEIKYEGSMNVGKIIDENTKQRELDYKVQKVTVTPKVDNWVSVIGLDLSGDCDLDDHAVNTAVDVTGKKCGSLGDFPTKNAVFYTSYRLEGEDLIFTQLPNEVDGHVGSEDAPAPRLTDLTDRYAHQ
jgi:hypothetical protein